MNDYELRKLAETTRDNDEKWRHHFNSNITPQIVLRLLDENAALRKELDDRLKLDLAVENAALKEQIAALTSGGACLCSCGAPMAHICENQAHVTEALASDDAAAKEKS